MEAIISVVNRVSKIKIIGGKPLSGTVKIGGAKNSAVALIPAAILCSGVTKIYNVPRISDIEVLKKILLLLNCKIKEEENYILIDSTNLKNAPIPGELTNQLRASYYFMGALLARFKKVEISFPGGCKIGKRPIDIHLFGFRKLCANVDKNDDIYTITADELIGNKIYLDFASVGATINIILASVMAKGKTIIENAAREPEIVNIASFLINMGAKIKGAGTSHIEIIGVKKLNPSVIEVFPDRIEAATYMIIGILLGNLKITGIIPEHLNSFLIKLREMKIKYEIKNDTIIVNKHEKFKAAKIKTLVYPGFPTDIQQPICTLLTQANGTSIITETIYENRYLQGEELNKMGAKTYIKNNKLYIDGPTKLKGAEVQATDLRCGAALVIAGLIADGTTIIDNIEHILRGYENIIHKLKDIGANIEIVE